MMLQNGFSRYNAPLTMLFFATVVFAMRGTAEEKTEDNLLNATKSFKSNGLEDVLRRIDVRSELNLTKEGNTAKQFVYDERFSFESDRQLFQHHLPSRISGGYRAPFNTALHTVFIAVLDITGAIGVCSGSILSSRHILTAGHCFKGSDNTFRILRVVVRIGKNVATGKTYQVKYVDVYRQFNILTKQNDVAIVWIDGSFQKPFKAVRLPTCQKCSTKPLSYVFAAGYGRKTPKGSTVRVPQETRLRVRAYTVCTKRSDQIAKANISKFFSKARVLCAMDPGYPKVGKKSVCLGDSGGPLFIKQGTGILQIGITSYGIGDCSTPGTVEWFVNLRTYVPFIKQYLNQKYTSWVEVYRA